MPTSGNNTIPISLYFHIPFCSHKCGYCHFFVLPNKQELKQQLLEGFNKEWQFVAPLVINKHIVSVYFGGGTPSLFGPERIQTVLDWIQPYLRPDAEITLEVNPEDATHELLDSYRAVGINRISIGVQTLDDELLQRLTRRHDAQRAIDAVLATASAGISNISIDLMYDIPGQTVQKWNDTLARAVDLPISHLSLYNLTIEPHTSFAKREQQLRRDMPDPDSSRQMYELAQERLTDGGLMRYEISAFARDGHLSRHNTGYWTGRPFLGLGPSAYSYWNGSRYRNVAHLGRYIDALNRGEAPVDFREQLDENASRREHLVIQLRLKQGVDLKAFQERFGKLEAETIQILQQLHEQNMLSISDQTWTLTHHGQLFYDTVASELV